MFRKMFRDAKRINPSEAMWTRIAARTEMPEARGGGRRDMGWRLAASLAIGMGALSAMLMVTVARDPGKTAARKGGAEDFAMSAPAQSMREPAEEENGLLDPELLEWHADLGEVSAPDWDGDPMMADPTLDE